MIARFEDLGLAPEFLHAVEQLGFEQPTPIQEAAIPALLAGRDVIGQAQTGTGKTAAFALPMLQHIQPEEGGIQALVLAPTRELAIQVAEAAGQMARGADTPVARRVLAVYGGQSYTIQTRQLRRGVDAVVGTPGRLLDLIRQKLLDLSRVRYLVLDEADEMLEMGFIEDVEAILAQIPGERQIALFSATLPEAVRKLAERYLNDPQKITINPERRTVAETEQRICRVREENKLDALAGLLEVEDVKSALIFARTKARAQELAETLAERGYSAEALHGDLNQTRREFVLNRFRRQAITILVATDVAARGLDIEDVSHVFNYDVPADAEDYVHRIGRTGRAGRKGVAITFLTPRERGRLKQIEAYTRQATIECRVPRREDILARRDEHFLERLSEQIGKDAAENSSQGRERALIARLVESGADPLEIAAAAIRMARAGESELPKEEVFIPATEHRTDRKNASDGEPARGVKKMPRRYEREWSQAGAGTGKAARRPARNPGEREPGMVRLKMNLGDANGLRPSDVVGAIASEVGIPGRAIGAIDIHREHTFLDVAEKHVARVLQGSGGKYFLRGKPVIVKLAN